MEIEVVLRDICECDNIVFDTKISEIIDAMAWSFEDEMCDTHFFCFPDCFPEFERAIHGHFWLIFTFFSSHPDLSGREEAYLSPRWFECSGYQSWGGCFPFCACDADHIHAFCWIAREGISEYTTSPVVDDSERTSESDHVAEILKRFHIRESIGKRETLSRGQNSLTKHHTLYNVVSIVV